MMKTIIIILLAISVYGTDISSLPWTMTSFPDNRNECDGTSGACGASVSWSPSGGWNNQPYVTINPPTRLAGGNGQYAGIGEFGFFGSADNKPIIHIRFLILFGSNYDNAISEAEDKLVIVHLDGTGNRPMLLTQKHNHPIDKWVGLAVLDDDQCKRFDDIDPQGANCWPTGNEPFNTFAYGNEWVCVEYEINCNSGYHTNYIWTQDCVLSGRYTSVTWNDGSSVAYIEGIGWYFNGYSDASQGSADSRSLKICELTISDRYIGPPAGFLDGGGEEDQPMVPRNLEVE